jgi:hypothetical protein
VAKERHSIAEWQQDPAFVYLMNNMNLLLVGPARRATKEEPVYILTLGEATLKSRLHMNSMVNSLCRRLGEVIDTKVYIISRQGDNSVHILPSREFGRMKTARAAQEASHRPWRAAADPWHREKYGSQSKSTQKKSQVKTTFTAFVRRWL